MKSRIWVEPQSWLNYLNNMAEFQIRYNHPKGWSSHYTLLLKAIFSSTGPVVEVGGGFFSTPLLHWVCKSLDRYLITYENDPRFKDLVKSFQSPKHKIVFLEDWNTMDFKKHYGVVFIDHHPPQRRAVDVWNFRDSADYIVMHDTNPPDKYHWRETLAKFKYQYDWTEYKPWSSVVSNLFDVTKWDNNILHL